MTVTLADRAASASLGALDPGELDALFRGMSKGSRATITRAAFARLCDLHDDAATATASERVGHSAIEYAAFPGSVRVHHSAAAVVLQAHDVFAARHPARVPEDIVRHLNPLQRAAPVAPPAPIAAAPGSGWSVECRSCGDWRSVTPAQPAAGFCPGCSDSHRRAKLEAQQARADRDPRR